MSIRSAETKQSERRKRERARRDRLRAAGSSRKQLHGLWQIIGDRDNWTCWICAGSVSPTEPHHTRYGPTVDHVVPVKLGGTNDPDNLRLAHRGCNSRRGAAKFTPIEVIHGG